MQACDCVHEPPNIQAQLPGNLARPLLLQGA